jgi:bacillithiol biosynthesis cysteine-adding enzyme BshC
MSAECYPITILPHVSQLYRGYLAMGDSLGDSRVRNWYGTGPIADNWIKASRQESRGGTDPARLADVLARQGTEFGASAEAMANIEKLRGGARAVVTGQQVGLFGGPLLTLLKAATAVARAKEATRISGVDHVPVFWLATEDHDLAEVNQVSLLTKTTVETLRAELKATPAVEVGGIVLGNEIEQVLEQAGELLGFAPVWETLRECYAPGHTLGGAFARLMARLFASQGLIVMDASSREFHALAKGTLQYAIEHADELEEALLRRTEELETLGYHAQVKVAAEMSLLFLISEHDRERLALLRTADGEWKAGRHVYPATALLEILEKQPERLSPNALLRPVFQDTILPTAAYIGGPAEIAYFAQSAVIYQAILGRMTPVLPRFSATLLEPAIATTMATHEVQLPDAMTTAGDLALRLGARAMPIEAKRKLAAAGNALDAALAAATEYLGGIDQSLGRTAEVSGSKMRYQMNRLRRMAASFELQKEASLGKHATAITLNVFPEAHPQERLLAGVWFLARYGEGLVERLVAEAANRCPGHVIVRL